MARTGVSAYPPEVTAQLVANIGAGGAAINVLADAAGATVRVPVGVDAATLEDAAAVQRGALGAPMTVADFDGALALLASPVAVSSGGDASAGGGGSGATTLSAAVVTARSGACGRRGSRSARTTDAWRCAAAIKGCLRPSHKAPQAELPHTHPHSARAHLAKPSALRSRCVPCAPWLFP